jgi:hypothetical protein
MSNGGYDATHHVATGVANTNSHEQTSAITVVLLADGTQTGSAPTAYWDYNGTNQKMTLIGSMLTNSSIRQKFFLESWNDVQGGIPNRTTNCATLSPIGNGTDEQSTERKAPIQSLFPTAACLLRASSYHWMNCLGILAARAHRLRLYR